MSLSQSPHLVVDAPEVEALNPILEIAGDKSTNRFSATMKNTSYINISSSHGPYIRKAL
jgi:hypothetical protein